MSRLDEEYIMAVVRNRSGIDAGEIDYNLSVDKFDRMSIGCLLDTITTLKTLIDKCEDKISQLSQSNK